MPTSMLPVASTPTGRRQQPHQGAVSRPLYVQDQIRLSPMFEIVAGLRFDRFALDVDNLNNGANFERTDELWSPRLGLIFKPRENLSLYASY